MLQQTGVRIVRIFREEGVTERMKNLRQHGTAVDTIAETLNTEGIKPRAGKQWYTNSVYRILNAAGPM